MADLFAELRRNGERIPGALALASAAGFLNYRFLLENIESVAAYAASIGVKAGQTVLVDCAGTDTRLLLTLGLMRLGTTVGFGKPSSAHVESGAKINLMVTDDPKATTGNIYRLSPHWFRAKPVSSLPPASDYALLFTSSGSTGKPKLMRFSRRNIDYRIAVKYDDEYFTDSPRYLSTSGNTTSTTLLDFFIVLMKGGLVIHSGDRSPQAVLDTIELFRPNYVSMAPAMLVRILQLLREQPRNLERVGYLRLNGAYCSVETREEALRRLARDVVISFGATEISRVAWGKLSDLRDVEGSVGRIVDGVEAETVDEEGHALPLGSEGEIRIKPPRPAVVSYPSAGGDQSPLRDGWFYPGDIGRVDPDGYLIVSGRKSLVINLGGNKVSPEAVEALLQKFDGIRDVGVLGIKDANGFDVVCAMVVAASSDVTLDAVNRFLGSKRSNFAVSRLHAVSAIPHTESGKIDREKLKELADRG